VLATDPCTCEFLRRCSEVRTTDLTLSCAAGRACRSRSGAVVAVNDVRRTASRSATAVTPSRWLGRSRLGRRTEAGPHQLQREVRPPSSCVRAQEARNRAAIRMWRPFFAGDFLCSTREEPRVSTTYEASSVRGAAPINAPYHARNGISEGAVPTFLAPAAPSAARIALALR
jgi:hypothetical protein